MASARSFSRAAPSLRALLGPYRCSLLDAETRGRASFCRQKLEEVKHLRAGKSAGLAAEVPEAVSQRRAALARRRDLHDGDDSGSSASGSDSEDMLAVDWRAKR